MVLAILVAALSFIVPAPMAQFSFMVPAPMAQPHWSSVASMQISDNGVQMSDNGRLQSVSAVFEQCANATALRRRYRGMAQVYHPDVPGGNAETFQIISTAYEKRLQVLRTANPLDTELQEALADLAETLSAVAARTVKEAFGSDAFAAFEGAARASWNALVGASNDLLEAALEPPSSKQPGVPQRIIGFVGRQISRARLGGRDKGA